MNVNELIQSARLFVSIFININNSENELISHTFSSSTHTLQEDALLTQLQIETPL